MRASSQKQKLTRPSANSKEPTPGSMSAADKQDRLLELRTKIEKERDAMRKTGKRFNKTNEATNSESKLSIEGGEVFEVEKDKGKGVTPFLKKENKVAELAVNRSQPQRQSQSTAIGIEKEGAPQRKNVRLAELIPSQPTETNTLSSSRLFEKEVTQQKTRNEQIRKFLHGINLGQYAEGLINMGYDQLDVLMEVKAEELNFLMMRAAQQKRLTEALDKLRAKAGLSNEEKTQPLMGLPSFFKTRVGMKAPLKHSKKQEQRYRQSSFSPSQYRPKSALTETSTIPTNNSQLFNNFSFFCTIGSNDWSMDSLIRRACSSCFKVLPSTDLQQRNECYYCKACSKAEDDIIGLTLSASMVRDYSQRQ